MILGRIISGKYGEVCIRQSSKFDLELGTLLVAESERSKTLIQVYDLAYGSQISQQNLELVSGLDLEEGTDITFFDPKLRNYTLAYAKNLISLDKNQIENSKSLPEFFSTVRSLESQDLGFLKVSSDALLLGNLRSGSRILDAEINLPARDAISHHILIPATTGKGKSNLLSVLLWNLVKNEFCGILVLDPHDEYYGRNSLGLKDHPSKNVSYYTNKDVPPGCSTLKINLRHIKPQHFNGALNWSDAQSDAVINYYKKYKEEWISAIMLEKKLDIQFNEATLGVVKRKISNILDIRERDGALICSGIFHDSHGDSTLKDISEDLEKAKIVIIDTSSFSGSLEILLGSLVCNYVFNKYKNYSTAGTIKNKPVIGVVIEEAPRVLGKEVLEQGPNIFSTIAREGRKFKMGLIAVTQLPSLIPRQILANMNTKIILGLEMAPERNSIIESSSHDLSRDARSIASLDKGEAIVSSHTMPFAIPIKIPEFNSYVKKQLAHEDKIVKNNFPGISLG